MKTKSSKIIELAVTAVSFLLLVLTIATYQIDKTKSNWASGPILFFAGLLFVAVQIVLLFSVWSTENLKNKKIILIISFLILIFYLFFFIRFNLNTT